MEANTLKPILDTISNKRPIPADSIRQWMDSDDDEVLGAVVELVTRSDTWERIEPSIECEEVEPFLITQYEHSIKKNPQGEWVMSRFKAEVLSSGFYASGFFPSRSIKRLRG